MTCLIVGHPEPSGPHGAFVAKFRCETHHMPIDLMPTTGPSVSLCPIGRIEQATEEALEKIRAARGFNRFNPLSDWVVR